MTTERPLTAPPLTGLPARRWFETLVGSRLDSWALPAIMCAAALNFLWQLGSPSYWVDEALSIEHSVPALGQVVHVVSRTENTPWTYFVLLHEWLGHTGSQSEWVVRLPSALAGVVLVGAVYWMARVFVDRRVALAAAALCALSPLFLRYAQQARVYVFAMLAVTVAVGATVRAVRSADGTRGRMLVAGGAAAALALWLHYTAVFVVVPLCVWLARRPSVPRRWRIAFAGGCAVAGLALLPLFIVQYGFNPDAGPFAGLTLSNVIATVGTPFDGRFVGQVNAIRLAYGVNAITIVGVAVIGASMIALLATNRGTIRDRHLLAVLGMLAPIALIVSGLAGKNAVESRYATVAAPFLLTGVAAAVSALRRPAAAALLIGAVAVSVSGLIAGHRNSGFWAPSRQAIDYIRLNHRPEDAVVTPYNPDVVALIYYGGRELRPVPEFVGRPYLVGKVRAGWHPYRLWIVLEFQPHRYSNSQLLRLWAPGLRSLGYRLLSLRTFTTSSTYAVFLARRARAERRHHPKPA